MLSHSNETFNNSSLACMSRSRFEFFDEMHHKSFFLDSHTAGSLIQTFTIRVVVVDQKE
jgi:hypothetical protein